MVTFIFAMGFVAVVAIAILVFTENEASDFCPVCGFSGAFCKCNGE